MKSVLFFTLHYYVVARQMTYPSPADFNSSKNKLFQIVEFEMEHAEALASLKGWENDKWNAHINGLLTNAEWGTEVELFAVASMLHVDVWTFYKNRWLCYRPRFEVHDGMTIRTFFFQVLNTLFVIVFWLRCICRIRESK